LFAVSLKQDAPGSYDFGFINRSRYINELTYTEVDNSRGRWGFKGSAYIIGNDRVVNEALDGVIGILYPIRKNFDSFPVSENGRG
jgi:aspergillopepsin I